jgi:S1-C subfamily serine protease
MQFTHWIFGVLFVLPSLQSAPKVARQQRPAPPRAERSEAREPGRLGVTLQDRGDDHGVLVASIEPQSPAEAAGIQAGDRILEVAGQAVQRSSDLVERIRAGGAGKELKLLIERDVEVTVESLPSENGEKRPRLGISTQARASAGESLRVESVESGTPAERAGIRAGDRLLALDGQPTPDHDSLASLVRKTSPGDKVTLRTARPLTVKLAAAKDGATAREPVPAPQSIEPGPNVAERRAPPRESDVADAVRDLRRELDGLRKELADLRRDIESLRREQKR